MSDRKSASGVDFEAPDLAKAVERLAEGALDALPFGVVKLDRGGRVSFYNETERRCSGYRHDVVGRHFFGEIAPCMNNPAFRGRIDKALAAGTLDIEFDYMSDLPSGARDVDLRIKVQSADDGGCWIFIQHP